MEQKRFLGKSFKLGITGLGLVAMMFTVASCEKDNLEEAAPLSSTSISEAHSAQENGAVIAGKYIVVFKEDADFGLRSDDTYERRQAKMKAASQALLRGKGIAAANLGHVYGNAIKGMAVGLSNAEVNRLRQDPRVAYIEQDRVVKLAPPPGKGPNKDKDNGSDPGQSTEEKPWGITRVNGGVSYTGSNVAWIIDTGIDLDHPDLNVDASQGFTAFTSGRDANLEDNNGHGSHVAGTVAAIKNTFGVIGVAAGAKVIPVKVLDGRGSGSYSGVIAGVDHVKAYGKSGDVANMSLGGPASKALDDAVVAASAKVKFSLAAGNDGTHAGNSSPARANGGNIYTISAVNSSDIFASWSNYGNPPVDYAAPGVSIKSTWKDGGYNTISGTSMAAPHVAGILLLGPISNNGGAAINDPDSNADKIAVR